MSFEDKSPAAAAVRVLGYTYILVDIIRPYTEESVLSLTDHATGSELQHEASRVLDTLELFRESAFSTDGGEIIRLVEESHNAQLLRSGLTYAH